MEKETKLIALALSEPARRLLREMVALLPLVKPVDPRTFSSYKALHDRLGLPMQGTTYGRSLQLQGLDDLADWTHRYQMPGITGLIIDLVKLTPGAGYYKLFGKREDDWEWWYGEIAKAKAFDWIPYMVTDAAAKDDSGWTDAELQGAVAAYLEMQRKERDGTSFVKKEEYEKLASRFPRTAKAFEYRMQNISYVLSLMGRDWLTGLAPAKNVGAKVAAQIEAICLKMQGKQQQPRAAFEVQAREASRKKGLFKPAGSRKPQTFTVQVTQYVRDPQVKAWVMQQAAGHCECCGQAAPFMGTDGEPFLEVHHVRKIGDDGSDTPENAVAICPNCHRALHYGIDAKKMMALLYSKVQRLIKE